MPSYLHESLVVLFRNRSESAPDLLRELHVQLPEFDGICPESTDINDLNPAEYRADLVLFLVRKSEKLLGVIVEVQLSRDKDKHYAWPAYVANLRARHRCPVCLLVVTTRESVAGWAEKPIDLGPGTLCKPWVIRPSNTPMIVELQDAQKSLELAVLSAVVHSQNPDTELATRVASAVQIQYESQLRAPRPALA